ncbi:hypothetical protein B0A50_00082 [Salinomyces thailandicus]|uniref:Wax synthase domain-containing protein n=1 Tax=Salinomyces thailandicus TaxID=706561 RepID=A0A4U0UGK8_9PEZI|nr:hypothetical protein B0A50_00082 [Salinomyces thailandica]
MREEALLFYHYLTHHIVPGPQSISYFVPLVLLPIALLVPRSRLSRWQSIVLFMPVMLACTLHAWWRMEGVDVISVDTLLWAAFLLVFRDPWRDFRWAGGVRRGGIDRRSTESTEVRQAQEETTTGKQTALPSEVATSRSKFTTTEQAYPTSFWTRLPWVNTLLVSIRLNNWKITSRTHDSAQPPSPAFRNRKTFVVYTLFCFARGYLTLDLTRAYISSDSYFTDTDLPVTSPLPFGGISGLPARFLRSMVVGAQAWALISQMFYLPCLLPVGLHALGWISDEWAPHNWPPYFGSPEVIFLHGIRGFWGLYWHQTMRWSVAGPGYAIADAVGLKAGGLFRYGIITCVAFLLSGTVHMGLVPPQPLHATMDANTIRMLVAGFFWMQPLGMLMEVLFARSIVATVGLQRWRSGLGRWLRMLLNGIWVVMWFTTTMPLLAEAGRQLGYWRVWPVPVSVWMGMRGEDWIAWGVLR